MTPLQWWYWTNALSSNNYKLDCCFTKQGVLFLVFINIATASLYLHIVLAINTIIYLTHPAVHAIVANCSTYLL